MGVLLSWAATSTLDRLAAALREVGGGVTAETIMRHRLEAIERQLASLIGAPYKEASMYLRERNVEQARQKLIQAMAQDETDLSARAMYCALIRETNPSLALEYYEDILCKFGPHLDIVPGGLVELLREYVAQGGQMVEATITLRPFEQLWSYYPARVYCSAWNIVVLWEQEPPNFLLRLFGPSSPCLIVYDWAGRVVLDLQMADLSVFAVTGDFVVVNSKQEGLQVWCMSRQQVSSTRLATRDALALFKTQSPVVTDTGLRWPNQLHARFGHVTLAVGKYDYVWRTEGPASQYGGGTVPRLMSCTSGELVLTRQRPLHGTAPNAG